MQVAALLDSHLTSPDGHRGFRQKLQQVRAALALERRWSKAEILEAYLNLVDFRGELNGIAATAAGLFGKSPAGLDETEAVLLAAILPSPGANAGRIGRRACAIAATGRFQLDCTTLRQQALAVLSQPPCLPAQRGEAPQLAQRLLNQAGERIRTTLDAGLQRQVAAILSQQLAGLEGHNARDGAAIVVDNAGGEVLAYVGSAGPFSNASQVDGVSARRQAGSTLKPFLYGLALERRYLTAASLLDDAPLSLETAAGLYFPQNYERDYKGWVSVRTALGGSLNIPAVRVVLLVGVEALRDRLRELGYLGLTEAGEYYGYSLALGAADVSLLEQVNAYRTLANGGLFGPLHLLPGDPTGKPRRVMSPESAFLVADILSDRSGRAVTFGLSNPLATRFWTAVKTGTSNNMRDNWCIGFSRRYTVGVWVGNFEGDAMRAVSGVSGAAPAWLEIMNALHRILPSEPPSAPAALVATTVRFEPAIEPARLEWFIAGTETGLVRLPDPATQPPRIETPSDGLIIALDPDIPRRNQAVLFTSQPAREDTYFLLDGVRLAPADRTYRWPPQPGRHTLELIGHDGERYHRISFQVRLPGG
jgi:penicillin-binding protein 1C